MWTQKAAVASRCATGTNSAISLTWPPISLLSNPSRCLFSHPSPLHLPLGFRIYFIFFGIRRRRVLRNSCSLFSTRMNCLQLFPPPHSQIDSQNFQLVYLSLSSFFELQVNHRGLTMLDDKRIVVERRVIGFSKLFLLPDLLLSFVWFDQGLGFVLLSGRSTKGWKWPWLSLSITTYGIYVNHLKMK